MGRTRDVINNTEIKYGSDLTINPQDISDKFHSFFMDTAEKLKSRFYTN
jgi:hypothetical protein